MLQAVGSTVEFRDSLDDETDPGQLLFLDRAARRAQPDAVDRFGVLDAVHKIVILGDTIEDDDVVALLRRHRLDHVIADADTPDEVELFVTSAKLLSGDIFGMEKYLAWGARIRELEVTGYEEKRIALLTVAEHARRVGARRPVVAKIESVTDELLMNAMYDAPAIRRGERPHARSPGAEAEGTALLRYGCDSRYFAVSVLDQYGELQKEAILDHLSRARAERGRPRRDDPNGGAGLGLYFILSSVTRFIANIRPGHLTEVVCLFDLRQSGRETDGCARSLHVFITPREETVED